MPRVLIHIGYPKAASTFLWQYFTSNPGLIVEGSNFKNAYIQSGKIPAEIVKKTSSNSSKYYVISEEQLSVWGGELDIVGIRFKPYDIKSHQKETCRELYSLFPDAKILIVTRGFRSALVSMYWQYVSIGGIFDFNTFQEKYSGYFSEFYDYNYLIDIYRKTFGENVVILPFELLKDNTAAFLKRLEAACDLPPMQFQGEKMNNALLERTESYRRLSSLLYTLIRPLPYDIQKKIYRFYSNLLYQRKLLWLSDIIASEPGKYQIAGNTIRMFTGKAEVLRHEKIFTPYLKEYLITEENKTPGC